MNVERLFIGGPADGKRIIVNADARVWRIPVLRDQAVPFMAMVRVPDPDEESVSIATYNRIVVGAGAERFDVFTEESLSYEKVFAMLIEGYLKPKE